jgi:hypothetical protein
MAAEDRVYFPLWNKLKLQGTVQISAPRPFHARIIKAVIKEKHMDLSFKYKLSENCQRATLKSRRNGALIIFTLHYTIGLDDI